MTNEDSTDLEIDSNRGTYTVNVTADGLDDDDLSNIFTDATDYSDAEDEDDDTVYFDQISDSTVTADFTDIDTGDYTFDFEVTDTSASSSDTVNVSEAGDGDIQFSEDVAQDQVGDVADITLEMDNTDEGTVTIGSNDQNYYIVAHVTDDDGDGEVNLEFNSFEAGTYDAGSGNDVLTGADADDDVVNVQAEGGSFANNNNGAAGASLLDATQYDMNVSVGHNTQTQDTDDAYYNADEVGTLSLQERSTNNATVWTAPDDANVNTDWDADTVAAGVGSNLTQADDIATDDWIVVQVEATGLEGALGDDGLSQGDVTLALNHTNPGANQNGDDVVLAGAGGGNDATAAFIADGDNDTYYYAVDSTASTLDVDREYEVNFTVDAGSELNTNDDEPETVTDSFGIVDIDSELNTNEDDMVLVAAADNQSFSGSSNLAPGTELTSTVESDDSTSPFLTRPEATVQPDGTLSFSADYSDLAVGTNLTIDFETGDGSEEYDGQVVEQVEETETATPEETETATATPTESTEEATEETTEEPDTETDTPTDDSGPGFTVIAALGALIAAALLAVRRNN
ncbi:PGF-CTERM sorting domain-containing protein [Halobacteria archaeon HArc-gm2]|nr:PGF-CTERM sorting domain-containing protein [Halobacteria archaeon HArc-gm2]